MDDSQKLWEKEYQDKGGIPTTTRQNPSLAVIKLLAYFEEQQLNPGKKVLDIGSGIGRNAIYLANLGYQVIAIEFIQEALDILRENAQGLNLEDRIETINGSIAKKLPFNDNSFDLAIDIVSTISLTVEEMKEFEAEIGRVLKPDGFFLTYVHSRDDSYISQGADENGYKIIPESGIREHAFTGEELRELYRDWSVVKMEKIEKEDIFYGKKYIRRIWWVLLQKHSGKP